MASSRLLSSVLVFAVLVLNATTAFSQSPSGASAQTFPNKAIRLVTTDAGGSADFFLRLLAQGLTASMGHPVVVDNRSGSGVIPGEIVSKAPADGHTVLFLTGNFWITPLLQKTSYDPVKDFAPVTLALRACAILVVTPSLPVNSVKDLVALAKAKPGELNYAHGSSGSASHMSGAMFKTMTGVNIVNIPYKGTIQAITDVISGQAQMMFPNAATVTPFIKSGKLKALAITCAEPSALFPSLPPVGASVPGFQFGSMSGMFAPAKTPEPVIKRLNQEVVKFVNSPDTRDRLTAVGVEPVGSTPQELAAVMKTEMTLWSRIIKEAGIKAD